MVKFRTQLVNEYLIKNNLSKAQFCKNINVSIDTLNRFLRGTQSVSYVSVISICNGIGISFTDFIDREVKDGRKSNKQVKGK